MFFIFIFGTSRVKKPVKGGIHLRRHCDRCHFISEMSEFSFRPYLTLFFIPVFPISKGESLLVCSRCEATFYPQAEDYLAVTGDFPEPNNRRRESTEDKAVIICDFCGGRLRVPFRLDRKLVVTCPHCKEKFDLKLKSGI
jgi:uncharacterized paraquat-inducible protein A